MAGSRHPKDLRKARSRPDPNGWQIVYTGFVLILLSFFIMLTSFASLQQSKITRFAHAFSNAVSVFKGGKNLEPGQTMIDGQAAIVDKEDKIARLFEKVRDLSQVNNLSDVNLRKTRSRFTRLLMDYKFASMASILMVIPLIHPA